MTAELQVDHEGDFVVFSDDKGGKVARIPAEDAIKLAHEILDEASDALAKSGQLSEYE